MQAIVFVASVEGHTTGHVLNHGITVDELRRFLEDYDDDDIVMVSYDGGCTFGNIQREVSVYDEYNDGCEKEYIKQVEPHG